MLVKWQIAAAIVLLMCQACAAPPSRYAASVIEVDAKQVQGCALLSAVVGRSLMVGAGSIGVPNAINDARDNAAGLGANRIVIDKVDSGNVYTAATVTAKAYKCN